MSELVTCPNGHRFPVNKKRHLNRNYRLCPRAGCGAKVIIRKGIWTSLSEGWGKQKEEQRDGARMGKKQPELPPMSSTLGIGSRELVNLFLQRKKELEQEKT